MLFRSFGERQAPVCCDCCEGAEDGYVGRGGGGLIYGISGYLIGVDLCRDACTSNWLYVSIITMSEIVRGEVSSVVRACVCEAIRVEITVTD